MASKKGNASMNGHGIGKIWLQIVQLAFVVLLPGVGFLASQTVANARDTAVSVTRIDALEDDQFTSQDAQQIVRDHLVDGAHPDAATKDQLAAAIASIEKFQALSYEQIRRELTDIKGTLARLEDRDG